MKIPSNRFFEAPDDEDSIAFKVDLLAHALLPWRVSGRVGFLPSLTEEEFSAHHDVRRILIERAEEADDLLASVMCPDNVEPAKWEHWHQAVRGIAARPEILLELSGEDFRSFHLALLNLARLIAASEKC